MRKLQRCGRRACQKDSKHEKDLTRCCWLWRWRGPWAKECGSFQRLRTISDWQPVRKQPQSHKGTELNSAAKLYGLASGFSPGASRWSPGQLMPSLWPCETQSRESSHTVPDFWPVKLWGNKWVVLSCQNCGDNVFFTGGQGKKTLENTAVVERILDGGQETYSCHHCHCLRWSWWSFTLPEFSLISWVGYSKVSFTWHIFLLWTDLFFFQQNSPLLVDSSMSFDKCV